MSKISEFRKKHTHKDTPDPLGSGVNSLAAIEAKSIGETGLTFVSAHQPHARNTRIHRISNSPHLQNERRMPGKLRRFLPLNPGFQVWGAKLRFGRQVRVWLEAFTLHSLAQQLARPANSFSLFTGSLFRRLFVIPAKLHFAENSLALHLLLERAQGLIDIVVTDQNLHGILSPLGCRHDTANHPHGDSYAVILSSTSALAIKASRYGDIEKIAGIVRKRGIPRCHFAAFPSFKDDLEG